MAIPSSIERTELLDALAPLGDLLGVDMSKIHVPFVIDGDHINITMDFPDDKRVVIRPDGNDGTRGIASVSYVVVID